jgi:4-carboxymuconolactone decarboxylase
MTTDDHRRRQGETNRRRVLGDAHVERSLKGVTPFNADWVDFITRTAWGDVWARPGLDYRSRSIIVLSVATALGRWEEFRIHVKGALHNGLTRDEIKEILIQCAVYAGVPAANTAFHEAAKVFAELDGAA